MFILSDCTVIFPSAPSRCGTTETADSVSASWDFKELFRLTRSDDEDETLEQISGLIDYFENRQKKMTEFEEDTFSQLVDNIIVKDRNELKFCLIGGLQFTEYVTERSRNYG